MPVPAPVVADAAPAGAQELSPLNGGELIRTLGCAGCHAGLPSPAAPVARPILPASLEAAAVFALLYGPPSDTSARPHPRFHLDEREAMALTRFLGGDRRGGPGDRAVRDATRRHADADSVAGARLHAALHCVACHAPAGSAGPPNGPPLALEGARVRPDWLRSFLRDPHAIRPSGVIPGDGGRMPDFALDETEADAIAAFLESSSVSSVPTFDPEPPTPFAASRTATLVTSRLSCAGCHTVDGRGGRIGPDLSRAGARLRHAWIRAMLEDPAHLVPGTIMPAMPGTAAAKDRVAAWLVSRTADTPAGGADQPASDASADRRGYLSVLDLPAPPRAVSGAAALAGEASAGSLYQVWCAACHGNDGRGDGFNAAFLAVRPADHTDAVAMSARPDDALFDAIAAGAFFMDRSAAMPGFASRLEPAAIRSLVRYIRVLCDCTQPAWAGDGRTTRPSGRD